MQGLIFSLTLSESVRFFLSTDVQYKKLIGNYHIVKLVVDVTDKPKCLTLQPLCVPEDPCVCGWYGIYKVEKKREEEDKK